jgi:signal transduction histidine kinase
MRVTVRDDGIGFDAANGRARNSLGLLNMEDRARLAGGTFSIHSRMGEGTVVTATIPATGISA